MHTLRPFLALALLTCSPVLFSVANADIPSARDECMDDLVETTPSAEFTPLEGGAVVRHERTGLEWRRCPEGMNWNGSGCDGNASQMNWQTALQHAHDSHGWRLPNINELRSIVELCRRGPAVNQHVFPDTRSSPFWSASPYAGDSGGAWLVGFYLGSDGWNNKSGNFRVRLVRGGQ
ncbi:DUF1566 domain-containing protein [Ectothiorhodospira variabilis]|uniref:Lcl C-terminal domain-containing protein n=1 Tax=Ectothiorhodospira variabilis TaxID=505694 RepID=UPI001EFA92EA|nr:DUF1566 domain-containing protein [Ectothiorhodospira variabilis]MCG5499158.1 DUF1566 domain-containing protein [Ectothiorhodospira variabilis]